MIDKNRAEQIARSFYEAIDSRDWNQFESIMTDQVNVAMRSPEREKKVVMTKEAVSTMWQEQFAMVYDKTCHVIKYVETILKDNKVYVKVDIDSTHYLGNENWTGIGTYVFVIQLVDDKYKITDLDYTLQIVIGDVAVRDRMVAQRKY